jgi:hypothetical protein
MRGGAGVLLGFVIGAVGVLTIQELARGKRAAPSPPPTTTLPAAQCEAVVRVWLDASGKPKVTPKDVCLAKHRVLTWDIGAGLEAGTVSIEFVDQGQGKGGFPADTQNNPHQKHPNAGRGSYLRNKSDKTPILSNPADTTGRWPYILTYTPDGGQAMVADPAVCIRN